MEKDKKNVLLRHEETRSYNRFSPAVVGLETQNNISYDRVAKVEYLTKSQVHTLFHVSQTWP